MAEVRAQTLASERATAKRWQSSFDSLRDGVCMVSAQARIVEANRALGALLAVSVEQLRGRILAHRFREAFAVEPPPILDPVRVCEPQETADLEVAGRVLRLSRDPIRDASGAAIGALHVLADVTDERRGENAVRFLADAERRAAEARAILDLIMQNAPLGIGVFDKQRRFVQVNAALAQINGIPPEQHLGKRVTELLPQMDRAFEDDLQHVLDCRESITRDISGRTPATGDALHHWLVSYYPLVRADGTLFGAGAIVADVTQRRRAEDQLRNLYEEAQHAICAREDVLASVSHDLKNPLTSVVMNATLLERATPEGPTGDKLRRHTQMIARAADRMNRLVHDLLDWASLRAGKLTLSLEEVPLAPLLNEIVTLLQPVALGRGQTLNVNVEDELTIRADRDRVARVLSNLIGNALKYTRERGAITVVARRQRNEALVAVTDTGPGIPVEELPHVFDRYFRAKQAGAEGTGLGLAIAKGIVEAHGGRIWAESMVGVGSTFAFTIPAL